MLAEATSSLDLWGSIAQLGSTGVLALLLVWLVTKGIPAINASGVAATALITEAATTRATIHRNEMHNIREQWNAERLVDAAERIKLLEIIAALRGENSALRSAKETAT